MSLIVGIDPGVETGVAFFRAGVLCELQTHHPVDLANLLGQAMPVRVVFEDSRLISYLYTTHPKAAAAKSMARKVGQVDMVCNLIVAACDRLRIPAHGISPKAKGAKLNAERFKQLTGWSGLSNEHTRDAAMVAWPYRSAKA